MILTRAFPGAQESVDLEQDDSRHALAAMYEPPRGDWLRLNFVASVNGSVAGADGTSESLSNPADRVLLGVIRNLSDVVLVGAASVRAEGYRVPRRARLAVVTSSGILGSGGFDAKPNSGPIIVLCPARAVSTVEESVGAGNVEIIVVGEKNGRLDPALMIAALRERGLRRIVCEGGPSLAAQLLNSGLVDELCLTTSPRLSELSMPLFGSAELTERELDLAQVLLDDRNGVYARWIVQPPS